MGLSSALKVSLYVSEYSLLTPIIFIFDFNFELISRYFTFFHQVERNRCVGLLANKFV